MMGNTRRVWLRVVLISTLILFLIAVAIFLGVKQYRWVKEQELSTFCDFSQEYKVYAMTDHLAGEPGKEMTLIFKGQKNKRGEFVGDITILNGDEMILSYHDCEINFSVNNTYTVIVNDGWTANMDTPQFNHLGGLLCADADWKEIAFLPQWNDGMSETEYSVFVYPAVNDTEAEAIFLKLYRSSEQ